jgi:hypothetical protein
MQSENKEQTTANNEETSEKENAKRRKRGGTDGDDPRNAKGETDSAELGSVTIADNLPKSDVSKGSHNL